MTGQFQFWKTYTPFGSEGSIEVVIHDLYDDDGGFRCDPVNTYQRLPVGASGFQWVLMCTNVSQWVPVGASGFSGFQCNLGLLDLLGLLIVLPPWTAEPH